MCCLSESQKLIMQELYHYNRIPLWILNQKLELIGCFSPNIRNNPEEKLLSHIKRLAGKTSNLDFDILCYENELYYIFSFECNNKSFYMLGGPMLLSSIYNITEMRNLSFAQNMKSIELELLVENLPVISFASFSSCLRIMMLLLKKDALSSEQISNFKFSNLHDALNRTFTHELFENIEEFREHTPYSHELALLHCVREGNIANLESTYKTLPQTKYGNMSNNPLKKLFYGCIANTTLITRYAIEGGLDEETAFTLSDVYIKQMESCRTLYELYILNEKMAIDFTRRVAKSKLLQQPVYSKPISKCINYISKNIYNKITLDILASEANLTPKYLSFLFRKETGQSLSTFIEAKKIDEAKNLLTYSDYSYSQISQSLSFSSQSYFIYSFKKNVGMTPKKYRENYSQ